MTELERLKKYLEEHKIPHEVKREEYGGIVFRNQIIVHNGEGKRLWDVICQYGSYGFEEGLLEGMNLPGGDDSLDVEGWLAADEIIKRLEEHRWGC